MNYINDSNGEIMCCFVMFITNSTFIYSVLMVSCCGRTEVLGGEDTIKADLKDVQVLNCDETREFWVGWLNGRFQVIMPPLVNDRIV